MKTQFKIIRFLQLLSLLICYTLLVNTPSSKASNVLFKRMGKLAQFSVQNFGSQASILLPRPPNFRPLQVLSEPVNQITWSHVAKLSSKFLSYEDEIHSQPSYFVSAERPVEQVGFAEIQRWIRRLNELTHLEVCSSQAVDLKLERYIEGHEPGDQYCLPTSEQWEDEIKGEIQNELPQNLTVLQFEDGWNVQMLDSECPNVKIPEASSMSHSNNSPYCLVNLTFRGEQKGGPFRARLEIVRAPIFLEGEGIAYELASHMYLDRECLRGSIDVISGTVLFRGPSLKEYNLLFGAEHLFFRLARKSDRDLPMAHQYWRVLRISRESFENFKTAIKAIWDGMCS